MTSIFRAVLPPIFLLASCALDHSTSIHHLTVESIGPLERLDPEALGLVESATLELASDGSRVTALFTPSFGSRVAFTGTLAVGSTVVANEQGAVIASQRRGHSFDEVVVTSLTLEVVSVDPLAIGPEVRVAGALLRYEGPEPMRFPVEGLLRVVADEAGPDVGWVPEIVRSEGAAPYWRLPYGGFRPLAPWDEIELTASEPVIGGALERISIAGADALVRVEGGRTTLAPRGWWPGDRVEIQVPTLEDHFGNHREAIQIEQRISGGGDTRSVDFATTPHDQWTTYRFGGTDGCDRGAMCRLLVCAPDGSGVFARLESADGFRAIRIGLRGTGAARELEPYAMTVEIAPEGEAPFAVETVRLPADWSTAGWQDVIIELPRAVSTAGVRVAREFHRCEIDHYVLVDSIEAM